MALKFPDSIENNNPNYPIADISNIKGNAYPLTNLSDTGSIPTNKRNTGAIVFVSSNQKYYGYFGSDTSGWNIASNWKELLAGNNTVTDQLVGFITTGSIGVNQTISGSLTVVGGLTGDIIGTASFAGTSLTASYNPNALVTASVSLNNITFTKGNGSQFTIKVDTGSAANPTLPGGNPGEIQYNNAGAFDGVPYLTYNGTQLIGSGSFSGSLLGTASTASFVTSSNVWGPYGSNSILSASWAANVNSLSSSYPFNATGSTIYSWNSSADASTLVFQSTISPEDNFIVGRFAGTTFTSASFIKSIVIGYRAGYNSISNNNNILIGESAGESSQLVSSSICIGNLSGINSSISNNSVNIGNNTGRGSNSPNIISIGQNAGRFTILSNNGIYIGENAGRNTAGAPHNILIGYNAGYNLTLTNSITKNNIIIGTGISLPKGRQDSINIGGIIFGTGSYFNTGSITSKDPAMGKIGINVVTPVANFEVSGSVRLRSLTTESKNYLVTYDDTTGQLYYTASSTIPGKTIPGEPFNSLQYNYSGTLSGSNFLTFNSLSTPPILYLSGTFNHSGSYSHIGNLEQTGALVLSPTNPVNINNNVSASYIYVSGSNNDLYFTQVRNGSSNTVQLDWIGENLYSGLLYGGIISASVGSTTYNISSGSAIIVSLNATTGSAPQPTIKYINWPNKTGNTPFYLNTHIQTFVGIDSASGIIEQTVPWVDGQYNASISLGTVIHQNLSTINAFINYPNVAYGWKQRSYDFVKAFGPLKLSGFTLAPSGSSVGGLIVGSGTAFADGRNYGTNPNSPSYINDAGTNVSKIFRYYQSGSSYVQDTNSGAGYTAIDPTRYNPDSSGSITVLSNNNKWSIQRAFWYPNSATKGIVVYYGTQEYDTQDEALINFPYEQFNEVPNTAQNAIYLAAMILKANADFTNPNTYRILQGGLFRNVAASGGASILSVFLASLGDVGLSTLNYGDLLMYGNGSQWINTKTLHGNYGLDGDLRITGSLIVSGGITGSLLGTASNAATASNILGGTADYFALWKSATELTTGSIYQTGSSIGINSTTPTGSLYVSGAIYFPSLTASANSINNIILYNTASGQLYYTASSAIGGRGIGFPFSGSAVITGSLLVSGSSLPTVTISGSLNVTNGITGSLFGTASNIQGGRDNYIALWTGSTTLTSSIIYQTGSSIGINSTTPTGSLYVSGTIYFPSLTASGGTATILMYNTASGQLFYTSSDAITVRTTGPGAQNYLAFFSGSTAAISSSNVYYDRTNGFIGINKSTPADSLDVVGGIRGTTFLYGAGSRYKMNLAQTYTNIYSEANNEILLGEVGKYANFVFSPTISSFLIGTDQISGNSPLAAYSLQIKSGSNELFNVSKNGNVGIGTSAPSAKLHISGSTPLKINGLTSPSTTISNVLVIDTTGQVFVTGSSGLAVSVFPFNGSAVITGSLLVSGSSPTVTISGSLNVTNGVTGSLFGTASNIQGGRDNYIALWTGSTALTSSVLYQTGSRIGLGTTNPTASFDINGDLNISKTTGANTGVIKQAAERFIHSFGTGSTFIGLSAGNTTLTASGSTGIGSGTLNALTNGHANTSVGYQSMYSTTIGDSNSAFGYQSLYNNTTGKHNTALGYLTLYSQSAGNENTAIGRSALESIVTGNNNTAIGAYAIQNFQTGSNNTLLGWAAADDLRTGSFNTILGSRGNTNPLGLTGSFNTILGAQLSGIGNINNNIIIADGSGNRRINVDSSGNVGIGKTTPNAKLDILGNTTITGSLNVTGSSLTFAIPSAQNGYILKSDANGGATWVSSTTVIDTGSFATTGSNLFIGNQTISGSLTISGSDTKLIVSGSLNVTNGITGSLSGTASFATDIQTNSTDTQILFNSSSKVTGDSSLVFLYTSQSLQQGLNVTASGSYSHAEGNSSIAYGDYSHTEGLLTQTGITNGYSASITNGTASLAPIYGNVANVFSLFGSGWSSRYLLYKTGSTYGYSRIISPSYTAPNTIITLESTTLNTGPETIVITDITFNFRSGSESLISNYSHTEGSGTIAIGDYSHAEGRESLTYGLGSHAEGYRTRALSQYSHAEGWQSKAMNTGAHAEGQNTRALGNYSHTEGSSTIASGSYSHAEGQSTQALGDYSHAEGQNTIAYAIGSRAEGTNTRTGITTAFSASISASLVSMSADHGDVTSFFKTGSYLFINDNTLFPYKAKKIDTVSYSAPNTIIQLIENTNVIITSTQVFDTNTMFDGFGNTGNSTGFVYNIFGANAHSEGSDTIAIDSYAHAEGLSAHAIGQYSHAEGYHNQAVGFTSHAEGNETRAIGYASNTKGERTIAEGAYQLVIGSYNLPSDAKSTFIIGNGRSELTRSNLLEASGSEVRITGSLITTGEVYFKGITGTSKPFVLTYDTASGQLYYTASSAIGGSGTGAGFPYSGSAVITGSLLVSGSSLPTVTISGSLNVTNGITGSLLGTASVATNVETNSTNTQILFNSGSKLAGTGSFLFIYTSQSLQQGNEVTASGRFSHAQGSGSIANGIASHAEGLFTVAGGNYQHVIGQYNISSSATSAFIIGNGINNSNRSNLVFANSNSFQVTGSLNTSGSQTLVGNLSVTGSTYLTSSGVNVLNVYGSGSSQPIFNVEGSVGALIRASDTTSGSLFSVNNFTGLPILEVFSDNTTYIGNFPSRAMYTSFEVYTQSGSNVIYGMETGSFDAMFVDYVIRSGSVSRAGNITALWSGSQTTKTETTTVDFGNSTSAAFNVNIVGTQAQLGITTGGIWRVKTIIKSI